MIVVVGSPFANKAGWIGAEIERREEAGEIGLIVLSFSDLYSALTPGAESTYRDQRASDSGAPRFASYLQAAALREAVARELDGYAVTDSPRRALAALEQTGGDQVVEVTVSQPEALRRSREHVSMLRDLAPRSAVDDGAAERCRQVVDAYYRERPVLDSVEVRQVRSPDAPSDRAIQYAWKSAIAAARRGDEERKAKWTAAAKRMLAARGVDA